MSLKNKIMSKVIIYARISTDEEKQRYSLTHQEDVLRKYCEIHNHEILMFYREECSAKNFNRPEFQKLLTYVKANRKEVDAIYFTKWDRFSRNLEEALRLIREFREVGVEVNAIEQTLDVTNPDNKAMLSLYLVMPEIENDKNSIRTFEGMLRAKKEGAWVGKAPFGYQNIKFDKKRHSIKPNDKAPLVLEAYTEVAKGILPADAIRRKMYAKIKLSKQAFLNMLRNKTYIGKIQIPAYKKEDKYEVDGLHDAIIPQDLFYRVQDVLNGRKKSDSLPSHRNELFPLRNHLKCGVCGENLTGSKSRGRNGSQYTYYHCRKKCPTYIRTEVADNFFLSLLSSLKVEETIMQVFTEILKDTYGQNLKESKEKQLQLLKEKGELQDRIINTEDRMSANDISPETYKSIVNRYEEQKRNINLEIELLSNKKDNPIDYLEMARLVLTSLDKLYTLIPYDLKRVFVGSIFPEKVIISNNECRTTSENEILGFLSQFHRETECIKTKKPPGLGGLSSLAPSPGLEPGTP